MRKRYGFTIIEVLVAMALIIVIMAILSEAFQVGTDSFGRLKSLGDMSDRLRAAAHIIRNDLAADHFNGSARLSDANFGRATDAFASGSHDRIRPREGYFMLKNYGTVGHEGNDLAGIRSIRMPPAPGQSQVLCMTVRVKGTARDNFYSASLPAGSPLIGFPDPTTSPSQPVDARRQDNRPGAPTIYRSPWAEVCYFLQPLPEYSVTAPSDIGGVQLYSLHRVVQLLVPDNSQLHTGALPRISSHDYGYVQISGDRNGSNLLFNTPRDVTINPARRGPHNMVHFTGRRRSVLTEDPSKQNPNDMINYVTGPETMLLSDVVSFSVELLTSLNIGGPYAGGGFPPFGFPTFDARTGARPDFSIPGAGLPAPLGGVGYDSSVAGAVPVLAVRITLRIWDVRHSQTRQVTIIQDM